MNPEINEGQLKILTASPLFRGIDPSELTELLGCLQPEIKRYRPKECVALSGDSLSSIGILLEGSGSIVKENAAGDCVLLALLEPGELFGEMAAFSPRSVWPATVTATALCTALFIPVRAFTGSCSRDCTAHRRMNENLLRVISAKALALNNRVSYLSMKSIRQKVCNFLLDRAVKGCPGEEIQIEMSRQQIADFLNVPRPSLSRELCSLRDEGLISFMKDRVTFLQPEELKRFI